jgi:mono/diheme cytochrome c family protein
MSVLLSVALAALVLGTVDLTRGQDVDDEEFQKGLIGHYSDSAGHRFERIDHTIGFVWNDQPPDVRLEPGPFHATWKGFLMSQAPGMYHIHAYVSGELEISLNGKLLLDGNTSSPSWIAATPVDLPFDWHPLEVRYQKRNDTAALSLYWSGPRFRLEPIGSGHLYHQAGTTPASLFPRGELLVHALRCGACHHFGASDLPYAAPSLDRLSGNIRPGWLVEWLTDQGQRSEDKTPDAPVRLMPSFGFSREDAEAVTAYLLDQQEQRPSPQSPGRSADVLQGDPDSGERLFLTVGCLACHRVGQHGSSPLFGGGDLSHVAAKRPDHFFALWLAEPGSLNKNHRMPRFELADKERADLAAYLVAQKGEPTAYRAPAASAELVRHGQTLFGEHRCLACHDALLGQQQGQSSQAKSRLSAASNWDQACTGQPGADRHRPGYRLAPRDRHAVQEYISVVSQLSRPGQDHGDGSWLLAQNNCLACHAGEQSEGIAAVLPSVISAHPELAELRAALVPPSLAGVGDKLHDRALADAIRRTGGTLRPWLAVRMPSFSFFSDEQLAALVRYFVQRDRIPDGPHTATEPPEDPSPSIAGVRLVTADGFGCTSCHAVGSVAAPKAPLAARGPDLAMLGQRIRFPWFDRWVRNPIRFSPRMEMPSLEVPVRGVLGNDLDAQLAAVWRVLNEPGFRPPQPDAVRVVRRSGVADRNERAAILTDVFQAGGDTFIKPLVIGLSNRHNVLIDLETNRLARWWIGDVARQRTLGKSWYWEPAGTELLATSFSASEMSLRRLGQVRWPTLAGQFPTEIDQWRHITGGVEFSHRLHFTDMDGKLSIVSVRQQIVSVPAASHDSSPSHGIRRQVQISGLPAGHIVQWRVLAPELALKSVRSKDGRTWTPAHNGRLRIQLLEPRDVTFSQDGSVETGSLGDGKPVVLAFQYDADLAIDHFLDFPVAASPPPPVAMNNVPGFEVTRLPLADDFMPTALAWRADGTLVVASLKGRVWLAHDSDGDELEDTMEPFSDELAAPYGLATGANYLDVINKYALLRLKDLDGDGRADETVTLASGWGHTDDYHDWSVGLPRDEDGNYYIATSCQQDDRSPAAAHLRGEVLQLIPRRPTPLDPRAFSVRQLSAGHRFPMGIARHPRGALLVTDNQGNFNPFNELNHVIPGAHYGFINQLERRPGFHPPLTPPAIDIPHPWTRSVNGISFLETPAELAGRLGEKVFGPLEGHLVGCEYDTRRLVRMTLQPIGDTFQGAVYPLSRETAADEPTFFGPLCCGVAPDGDLYIGCIRDSGWGGGNNVGALVRMRPQLQKLPAGIAEVRAGPAGFSIDFTRAVDRELAADPSYYSIVSFTRISTPDYGGDDQDRRVEKVTAVRVSDDGKQVALVVGQMRIGYVYHFRLKNLSAGGEDFFPAEAFFTLRHVSES